MGGKCSTAGYPKAYTLNDLADVKLNELYIGNSGCGPAIDDALLGSGKEWLLRRGFNWPKNGEFDWGGLQNNCSMCNNIAEGYGCECNSESVTGKRGSIKRVAYKADPADCCINQTKISGNYTCDPKYRHGFTSSDCDNSMLNYCNSEDRWTSPICRQWVNESINVGRSVANSYLNEWCSKGKNFDTNACQEWCSKVRSNPTMRSACDQASLAFCKNYPQDNNCSCAQTPIEVSKIESLMTLPKVCWYKPCQNLNNDNYITSVMADNKKTCTSTVCQIDAGDINVSGTGNKITFDNKCATNIVKPEFRNQITPDSPTPSSDPNPSPTSPITPTTPTPITPPENEGTLGLPDSYLYIGGGVSFLLICIVSIIVIIAIFMLRS